ncbi:hypothetical protein [Algoriphagus machipongonensis]|uniref:Uncharacterized protein n=1 Tax=Algoriphagus machipongonensis TaxID=388413 RepID=A3HWF1_9BACT|nr:hypothetical protein [Algoriphagus machipongonensis]EAZ80924.1 hypothetical protein ALPR1_17848 [Algoriphagus machipongonensis]
MKVFAILLSLFSFWLTAMPCCSEESSCDTIELKQNSDSEPQDDCNDHLPCSPFYSCGSCTGFSAENFSFPPLLSSEEVNIEPNAEWSVPFSEQHRKRILKPPGKALPLFA